MCPVVIQMADLENLDHYRTEAVMVSIVVADVSVPIPRVMSAMTACFLACYS